MVSEIKNLGFYDGKFFNRFAGPVFLPLPKAINRPKKINCPNSLAFSLESRLMPLGQRSGRWSETSEGLAKRFRKSALDSPVWFPGIFRFASQAFASLRFASSSGPFVGGSVPFRLVSFGVMWWLETRERKGTKRATGRTKGPEKDNSKDRRAKRISWIYLISNSF